MKQKPLCPILLIGFPAPEEGKRDLRRCTTECALYNNEYDCCSIKACAETTQYLSGQIDDLISLSGAFVPFEENENFEYNPNTIGATN